MKGLKRLMFLKWCMGSKDYMRVYVDCENHPKFKVFIPFTLTTYMLRTHSCPICDSPARLDYEMRTFKLKYDIIDSKKLSKMYAKGERPDEIFSIKCNKCNELSVIGSLREELGENLKISSCPVCGYNDIKTERFYVDLSTK